MHTKFFCKMEYQGEQTRPVSSYKTKINKRPACYGLKHCRGRRRNKRPANYGLKHCRGRRRRAGAQAGGGASGGAAGRGLRGRGVGERQAAEGSDGKSDSLVLTSEASSGTRRWE